MNSKFVCLKEEKGCPIYVNRDLVTKFHAYRKGTRLHLVAGFDVCVEEPPETVFQLLNAKD